MTAPKIHLEAGDAVELAEMLTFISDWLRRDCNRLEPSLQNFVGSPGYTIDTLRADLERHEFLLGGDDGEIGNQPVVNAAVLAVRFQRRAVMSRCSPTGRSSMRMLDRVRMTRPGRYTCGARLYDVLSGERPVYRAGRQLGIAELQLQPGDRVLDVGCGTGLNFPLLLDAVGPSGAVVGVDASGSMLSRARARRETRGWSNVTLLEADAAQLNRALDRSTAPELFDAALFTYSLSIIDQWQDAFAQTLRRVRPGGRIVVVDMALPVGGWRVLSPLARLASFTGGADITRAPWNLLLESTSRTTHRVVRGGHIHIGAGSRP